MRSSSALSSLRRGGKHTTAGLTVNPSVSLACTRSTIDSSNSSANCAKAGLRTSSQHDVEVFRHLDGAGVGDFFYSPNGMKSEAIHMDKLPVLVASWSEVLSTHSIVFWRLAISRTLKACLSNDTAAT